MLFLTRSSHEQGTWYSTRAYLRPLVRRSTRVLWGFFCLAQFLNATSGGLYLQQRMSVIFICIPRVFISGVVPPLEEKQVAFTL